MTNEELVKELKSCKAPDRRKELLTELYSNNVGFISKLARYYSGCNSFYSMDDTLRCDRIASASEELLFQDLCQEGYLGLVKAAEKFEESADTKFITYAGMWIKQFMLRYIQNKSHLIRLPVPLQEKLYKLSKVYDEYQQKCGKAPSVDVICRSLNVTASEAMRLQQALPALQIKSLEEPIDDEPELTYRDAVSDGRDYAEEVEQAVDGERLSKELWKAVNGLKEKQAKVISLYYADGLKLDSIASRMNITHQAASLHKCSGLTALRNNPKVSELKSFLDSDAYSLGLRDTGYAPFIHKGISATEAAAIKLYSK